MILQMTRPVQTGLREERKFELISNHIANADTTGFKKGVLSFDEMMRANLTVDLTQGDIVVTNNKLDIALTDEGFFRVQTPYGTRYTRDGNFHLDLESRLVTANGDLVLGEDGPITIEGNNVNINHSGEVYTDGEVIGRLSIVTFERLNNIYKEGSGYFIYKGDPQDEIPPKNAAVRQGALERSNVTTVIEMTKMIESHRMFETAQKMMQTFDEVDGRTINDVGKLV